MQDSERVGAALQRDFPNVAASKDRAWSRVPALRVIDCVLSLNRNYDRFVVPRLDAFENRFPDTTTVKHLRDLMDTFDSPATFVHDALNYRDAPRAQVLSSVIDYLLGMMAATEGDSELEKLAHWARASRPEEYRRLGIRGFALAGFQYLRMLFGANTTKPDVHIRRYVGVAIGHRVSDVEALSLLEEAATRYGLTLRDVDTTIWEASAR